MQIIGVGKTVTRVEKDVARSSENHELNVNTDTSYLLPFSFKNNRFSSIFLL